MTINFENIQRIIDIEDTKTNLTGMTGTLKEVVLALASDTGELGVYDGSAWAWVKVGVVPDHDHSGGAGDGDTFDATNLTSGAAGDGDVLTADGVGGAAWEAPAAGGGDVATDTIWDAKGDLAVGTGADTASRLSVGADGKYLKAASGEATGLKWDTPTGGGDVLGPATSTDEHLAVWDGTDNKTLKDGGAIPSGGGADYICVRDKKNQNTQGGTFTSGAWQTREITQELSDDGNHCSIGSNQITLAAGTYTVHILAPANHVNNHQAMLYDVTNAAVLLVGTSAMSSKDIASVVTFSAIVGRIVLAGSTVLEVRHRCSVTYSTYGLGLAANFTDEVYTVAEFWKVG